LSNPTNMKSSFLLFFGLLLLLTACNKSEVETPNGFKYKLIRKGDAEKKGKTSELVVFNYTIKDSKDSMWIDSKTTFPGAYQVPDSSALSSEIGMQQMFRMVTKGDSITVSRPVSDFFKNVLGAAVPPNVDTAMTLTLNMGVIDIMNKPAFDEYQNKLAKEMSDKQNAKDIELIDKYLAEKNIKAESDSSGIRYVLYTNNGKQKPTVQNCVEVKYRGKLLNDGKVFDQNDKISFPLGRVIPGWQIGIPKLGIGDSATLYIPSSLAYGPRGSYSIPPNAVLIFDVQLLGVKQYDPVTNSCK
jgi:FKBP-type peptidyl-prolyl cis-trans isomerase FkpA